MANVNNLFEFGMILIISLLGALGNDYYNTLTSAEAKISISKILLGAFTGAMILYGISDRLEVSEKLFTLLSFVFGVGGFSLFGFVQKLDLKKMFFKSIDFEEEEK